MPLLLVTKYIFEIKIPAAVASLSAMVYDIDILIKVVWCGVWHTFTADQLYCCIVYKLFIHCEMYKSVVTVDHRTGGLAEPPILYACVPGRLWMAGVAEPPRGPVGVHRSYGTVPRLLLGLLPPLALHDWALCEPFSKYCSLLLIQSLLHSLSYITLNTHCCRWLAADC